MRITGLVVILTLTAACGQGPATPTAEPQPAAEAAAASNSLDLGSALFDLPEDWVSRAPSSSMRLAEAEIPGEAGPALLTVFFFGAGGGGGTEANLERWVGQVDLAEGTEPAREQFDVGGFVVHTVRADGTLKPSTMGAGPTEPVPGSALLGAVVEGDGGPWFFKITGPAVTVDGASADFDGMLRSVRAPASAL
jgi:hypothetical protein